MNGKPSTSSRFLSSITLVALGAIGGFAIFHSALQYRIDQTQQRHNATLELVSSRYVDADQERKRCIETDDGRLQEISELRGRLDSQHKSWYDLTAMQRSVQQEHEQQMQRFREVYERDQRALASLRVELDAKDKDLVAVHETMLAVQNDLQRHRNKKAELESELSKLKETNKEETNELKAQVAERELKIERIQERMTLLVSERDKLETESRELRKTILQKDRELENANQNSNALEKQKESLEQYVAEIKAKKVTLESQIVTQEKELHKYQQEEGELETKLINFREGMLQLLKEKIQGIKDLEKRVDVLNQEKADLEEKLENWREGMLELVKGKLQEIELLKSVLAESQESTESTMKDIEQARSEQIEAEEFVKERLDRIEQKAGDEEFVKELIEEIEHVRVQLKESQDWLVTVTKEVDDRKADQIKSEELILDKTNEIHNLKLQIEKDQESTTEQISRLESDLHEAKQLVVEQTNEIERLNSEIGEFVTEINNLKSVLVPGITTSEMMINHVQQRDGMICRQLFGKGPYYVKFVVKLPTDDSEKIKTLFFVIELSSRKELPHSTYTFLTLVESNLYNDGVAFLSARADGGLRISSGQSPDTMSLEQKLKPLGLTDGSSLSFAEAPLPCGENSLGFVRRGPGLDIFLPSDVDNQTGCFAQVIRGQENLQKVQSAMLEGGEPMEIVSVKHLRVD
mmetsp:Transcript_14373/g.36118  ORF Transcript_14373/g.36118 Transcript_14373/m.36118 type:complete len:693 (-) Transcript_14373:101-2179(-)